MPSGSKGIVWDHVPLGLKPDTVIAKELGVASQSVALARSRRGIAAFHKYREPTQDEWNSCGLGEKPDSEIAISLGVPRERVGSIRRKHGIPAFVGLVLLQDGTPCRSVYEAMYDAVLHYSNTEHEHEVPFKDLNIIADLVVEGTVVEIAGMNGYLRYDQRRLKKESTYKNAGIQVTWLTNDYVLNASKNVPVKIKTRERYCLECKIPTIDLVHGRCRPCQMRHYRTTNTVVAICEFCEKEFTHAVFDIRKFCNRECYGKSLELDLPSQNEIDELVNELGSVNAVARKLGIKSNVLGQRAYRQRVRARQIVVPSVIAEFSRS